MPKGRPPKPTNLHVLHGTARKDRHGNRIEPEPEVITEIPEAPESLREPGVKCWDKTAKILLGVKVLTDADLDTLESYCIAYQTMLEANSDLDRDGLTQMNPTSGLLSPHPSVNIMNKAQAELRQTGTLLGLSPSARTRINVPKKDDSAKAGGALRRQRSSK